MTAIVGLVDALRLQGAAQLDPVGFRYIEFLEQRASTHQGRVKYILDGKIAAAALAMRRRIEKSHVLLQDSTAPASAARRETLGDLVRFLSEHSLDKSDTRSLAPSATPRTELKSVQYFRNTWSKLSAERDVTQALGHAPKNAGPINSHVVALRSLALMRDTSPDYLNRFMSYVDTLLCLEQGDRPAIASAKTPRVTKPKSKLESKPKPKPK